MTDPTTQPDVTELVGEPPDDPIGTAREYLLRAQCWVGDMRRLYPDSGAQTLVDCIANELEHAQCALDSGPS
jgi:hypothetical protein